MVQRRIWVGVRPAGEATDAEQLRSRVQRQRPCIGGGQGPAEKKVRYGMVWYGVVRYGMVWYGVVWYGVVWRGMVWYGMV